MNNFENIVISSRVRLARNVDQIALPAKLADELDAMLVAKGMYELLNQYGDFEFYKLKNLTNLKSLILLEQNLISKELLDNKDIACVAVETDTNLSVMINEEDHIREQCVLPGFALQQAYEQVNALDELILENFDIAFDKQLGFLTSSPTNLGTGMRASVMLFLPGTTMMGRVDLLAKSAQKLGLTVRGKYGENSMGEGYMYQISNEACLGFSEQQILQNVINVTEKICEMEQEFLSQIMQQKGDEIVDIVGRAWGLLTNSHLMTAAEAIKLLSHLKLGVVAGIIKLKDPKLLDQLTTKIQPAHLIDMSTKELNQAQRHKFRAQYLTQMLKDQKI
jgi:protein arginine kinase